VIGGYAIFPVTTISRYDMFEPYMLGPFTIAEILGAALTGVLVIWTYRTSAAEVKNQSVAFVAASCVVLTLLLSLRFQLLPMIQDDLQLEALRETSKETDQLFQILSRAPNDNTHPLMAYILQIRLNSINDYFDDLGHGRFVVDQAGLPQFLLDMVKSAKKQIVATSYAQPASWWDQPWGKLYESENEEAVKRGVKVTRTFLFANEAELNAIRPLLSKEVNAGIKVKYAFVANLHADLVNGLVVIDDSLAGELHLTPTKGVKEAVFYTRTNDIEGVRGRINEVQSEAQDLEAVGSEKKGSQ
jgi:hypothetical protein